MTDRLVASHGGLTRLGDGVYAYLQPPGTWCLSNAAVIAGDGGVVLVDTAATRARAEHLRRAVEALRLGPVETIVNTHHHGDHVFGNCVFPDAAILGHRRTGPEMDAAGLALTRLWPAVDWGAVSLRTPTRVYDSRLELTLGGRRVELHHPGPAHTTNDTLVWLPEERILFAGDVVIPGCTPFALMGSIRGSLEALALIRALDPAVVVGGHGPVAGPAAVDETERYLRWIWALAERGAHQGREPLDVARTAEPGEFYRLLDPERVVGNLHRAGHELRRPEAEWGAEIDVLGPFGEMIEFNGGEPLHCVA